MDSWADAIVAVAFVLAVVLAVLAFRGLIDAVDGFSGRCLSCHRTALLPLPVGRRMCRRCSHQAHRRWQLHRLRLH